MALPLPVYPQYSVGGDAPQAAATTATPAPLAGGITPTSATSSTSSTQATGAGTVTKVLPTGPYPDRELPSWLPPSADTLTGELAQEYANVPAAYDTSAVDAASAQQQARDLTGGLRAANAAATSYAATTMQRGGSAAAAGLIKAQGQVGALNAAGQAKVEAAKYDVQQREAAAGQAAQIASTLSGLRTDYLKTLTGYAAAEDVAAIGTETSESQSETSANQAISGTKDTGGSGGSSGGGRFDPVYTGSFGPALGQLYSNVNTGERVYSPAGPGGLPQADSSINIFPGSGG